MMLNSLVEEKPKQMMHWKIRKITGDKRQWPDYDMFK